MGNGGWGRGSKKEVPCMVKPHNRHDWAPLRFVHGGICSAWCEGLGSRGVVRNSRAGEL